MLSITVTMQRRVQDKFDLNGLHSLFSAWLQCTCECFIIQCTVALSATDDWEGWENPSSRLSRLGVCLFFYSYIYIPFRFYINPLKGGKFSGFLHKNAIQCACKLNIHSFDETTISNGVRQTVHGSAVYIWELGQPTPIHTPTDTRPIYIFVLDGSVYNHTVWR